MITENRARVITTRFHELKDLAGEFVNKTTNRWHDIQIDESCNILYEVNTSCHCHPEYETKTISSVEFFKWLNDRNKKA